MYPDFRSSGLSHCRIIERRTFEFMTEFSGNNQRKIEIINLKTGSQPHNMGSHLYALWPEPAGCIRSIVVNGVHRPQAVRTTPFLHTRDTVLIYPGIMPGIYRTGIFSLFKVTPQISLCTIIGNK